MQDMVKTMFREQSLEELFKPQPIPSRKGLQMLLQGVAHSSIMRLSNTAMDKVGYPLLASILSSSSLYFFFPNFANFAKLLSFPSLLSTPTLSPHSTGERACMYVCI